MSVELKVPMLPESVTDATVVNWHKSPGDAVTRDETLVDLETDKVVLEVPCPEDGVLEEILKPDGETVMPNDVLALIKTGAVAQEQKPDTAAAKNITVEEKSVPIDDTVISPAVRRLIAENDIDVTKIKGTGKSGRVVREDVEKYLNSNKAQTGASSDSSVAVTGLETVGERVEKRVPMTRLRKRIAERLLDAQHNAAILTTFNEVNMQPVMDLRKRYKDAFEKKHGVRLGFTSFFAKAVVEALKEFPSVNASIDGDDIVYHGFFDIGVAVSTERGLVVPVLRDVDNMSMADIESGVAEYAKRARDGQLSLEEMTGGNFTITNGGVFGSLLSTPILNPPQSGILGLHKIEERAVVENGEVVVRPMMYLALSYDHRIIDGRESVQFLVCIKNMIEDPARLLLEI